MLLPSPALLLLAFACWAPDLAPSTPEPPPDALPEPVPLPAPPFTARTTTAPLTLVGPGGVTLAQLPTAGLQVEVLQVLPERVRVRCTACPGEAAGAEGWLQRGAVQPASGG